MEEALVRCARPSMPHGSYLKHAPYPYGERLPQVSYRISFAKRYERRAQRERHGGWFRRRGWTSFICIYVVIII
jgi:hypothetical protein